MKLIINPSLELRNNFQAIPSTLFPTKSHVMIHQIRNINPPTIHQNERHSSIGPIGRSYIGKAETGSLVVPFHAHRIRDPWLVSCQCNFAVFIIHIMTDKDVFSSPSLASSFSLSTSVGSLTKTPSLAIFQPLLDRLTYSTTKSN